MATRKITLKSSDGEAFEVDEAVALKSPTIKSRIADDGADSGITLPKVTSKILAKVIDYCKKHVEASNPEEKTPEEDLKAWDADFVKVDQATLFDLILRNPGIDMMGEPDAFDCIFGYSALVEEIHHLATQNKSPGVQNRSHRKSYHRRQMRHHEGDLNYEHETTS